MNPVLISCRSLNCIPPATRYRENWDKARLGAGVGVNGIPSAAEHPSGQLYSASCKKLAEKLT